MKFDELLQIIGQEPVFETGLLLAGSVDAADIRRQLSRWRKAGRIVQLRRGLYALAAPFRKTRTHPFVVANRLVRASYVSCQSALAYHGLIPEAAPVVTSVTTLRPGRWETPWGLCVFRHIQPGFFHGYELTEVGPSGKAFVASPAKALLDLIYLQPGADAARYIDELRLQNLERLDVNELQSLAERSHRPRLLRAARRILAMVRAESSEYESI
jgi:predicted transcriptional regulator of viral defense system